MSDSKFYKTVMTVTIISDTPVHPDATLSDVEGMITSGDWSGMVEISSTEELSPKETSEALIEQGTDPAFFGLDEED
jgi:hypothetical protein